MTVFDLAKNLPSPTVSHLLCRDELLQRLKEAARTAKATEYTTNSLPILFTGIRIYTNEDALDRKIQALTISMTADLPVLYEDDEGNICEVTVKPGFNPFLHLTGDYK